MFDCSKEMKNFHGDKVTLSTDMRNEMRERRNNGRTRLDKGLERDGHKTPAYFAQGSYAMHTMVQDDAKEFDIDDGAYFSLAALTNADGIELTTTQAKERVRDAIRQDQRLKEPADIHDNCVRQVYPAGYHIDIPVYRIRPTRTLRTTRLRPMNSPPRTPGSRRTLARSPDGSFDRSMLRATRTMVHNSAGSFD
jgi:hypothetical protein